MAGINPFGTPRTLSLCPNWTNVRSIGWSRSLNYTRETYGKEVSGGLAITTFFGYFVMRMALGVNTGLVRHLELPPSIGSFVC